MSNDKDNNNKSCQKATNAYELYDKGKKPAEVAVQLSLSEKEYTNYIRSIWKNS